MKLNKENKRQHPFIDVSDDAELLELVKNVVPKNMQKSHSYRSVTNELENLQPVFDHIATKYGMNPGDEYSYYETKPAEETNLWVSRLWHCDVQCDTRVKLFVYFNEVGDDNGPFKLSSPPIWHDEVEWKDEPSLEHLQYKNRDFRTDDEVPHINITGKKYTMFLVNVGAVHRAAIPTKGMRKALTLAFTIPGGK